MDITQNLKLNKPTVGSTNWGGTMNNNLDIIDAYIASLESKIRHLETRLGQLNYINLITSYNYNETLYNPVYVKISREDGEIKRYLVQATVNNDYDTENDQFKNVKKIFDIDSEIAKTVLQNYDAFSVIVEKTDYDQGVDYDGIKDNVAGGAIWTTGDVLIIHRKFDGTQIQYSYSKFPQTVGGYYIEQPETLNATNTFGSVTRKFIKVSSNNSPEEYELKNNKAFYYKPTAFNLGGNNPSVTLQEMYGDQSLSTKTATLSGAIKITGAKVDNFSGSTTYDMTDSAHRIEVSFYLSDQRIWVDYKITYSNKKATITAVNAPSKTTVIITEIDVR